MQTSRQFLESATIRSLLVGAGLTFLGAVVVFGSPMRATLGYHSFPVEHVSYAPLAQGPAIALTRSSGDSDCVRVTKIVTTSQGPYGGLYVPRGMTCE